MGYPTTSQSDGLQKKIMACSVMKRTGTSFERGSEMVSGGFLPKKCKFEYPTNGEPLHVELVKEDRLSDHNPTRMNESSFEFPQLSQEELKKIYGGRRQRLAIRKSSIEDSEESEEEEGLTREELKQTEGYKSLIKCIEIMAQKQSV